MSFNGFVLAGTHSGAGKTTITAGVLGALKKRGMKVQPFKTGPDYIDPAFHNFVVGTKSRNLDTWMMSEEVVRYLYAKNVAHSDVAVVEGVMGLFDGLNGTEDIGSTAYLAKLLKLPVILIVDGSGMARSAAAIVKGFSSFDPDCHIAGVILNRLSGAAHYELMKEAVEKATGILCFGYVQKNVNVKLSSRHLGLIPAGEVEDLENRLDEVIEMIEQTVELDQILKATSQNRPEVKRLEALSGMPDATGLRVGVALDASFNFYYQDNLELMAQLGAQIVYFSPMVDKEVPKDLDFLYFGGGFPEVFAKQLSENTSFLESLKAYHQSQRPIYGECGGFMYLTEAITDLEGIRYPMAGIIAGETLMTKTLKRFGYAEVESSVEYEGQPLHFRAHEFHRSEYSGAVSEPQFSLYKNKGHEKEKSWQCGYKNGNTFGAYAHVHFYSNVQWLAHWLTLSKNIKEAEHESI